MGKTWPAIAGFDDDGGQKPRNSDSKKLLSESHQKETLPSWHRDFSPGTPISNFWPPKLWDNEFVLFEATQFGLICSAAIGNWHTGPRSLFTREKCMGFSGWHLWLLFWLLCGFISPTHPPRYFHGNLTYIKVRAQVGHYYFITIGLDKLSCNLWVKGWSKRKLLRQSIFKVFQRNHKAGPSA